MRPPSETTETKMKSVRMRRRKRRKTAASRPSLCTCYERKTNPRSEEMFSSKFCSQSVAKKSSRDLRTHELVLLDSPEHGYPCEEPLARRSDAHLLVGRVLVLGSVYLRVPRAKVVAGDGESRGGRRRSRSEKVSPGRLLPPSFRR